MAGVNLCSNQADGPVITIHDLPQDVTLDDLKKHVRIKVPEACLNAGFFWMNSKGKQLRVLNSDQDLSEAKRTSEQGTIRLAVVVDSGVNAVFTKLIILQVLGTVRNTTWVEILSREQQVKLSFFNYCSILRLSCHVIFSIYSGTVQSKKNKVWLWRYNSHAYIRKSKIRKGAFGMFFMLSYRSISPRQDDMLLFLINIIYAPINVESVGHRVGI